MGCASSAPARGAGPDGERPDREAQVGRALGRVFGTSDCDPRGYEPPSPVQQNSGYLGYHQKFLYCNGNGNGASNDPHWAARNVNNMKSPYAPAPPMAAVSRAPTGTGSKLVPELFAMLPSVALLLVLVVATKFQVMAPPGHDGHAVAGNTDDMIRQDVQFYWGAEVANETVEATGYINEAVAGGGPLLPLLVLGAQWCLLPYRHLEDHSVITGDSQAVCGWQASILLLWVGMAAIRICLYVTLRSYNYYFSDHIFLITCLVGQIQTKLFVLHLASRARGIGSCGRTLVPFLIAWILIAVLLVESFITARYFHTVVATWSSFAAGTLLFSGFAMYWVRTVRVALPSQQQATGAYHKFGYA